MGIKVVKTETHPDYKNTYSPLKLRPEKRNASVDATVVIWCLRTNLGCVLCKKKTTPASGGTSGERIQNVGAQRNVLKPNVLITFTLKFVMPRQIFLISFIILIALKRQFNCRTYSALQLSAQSRKFY